VKKTIPLIKSVTIIESWVLEVPLLTPQMSGNSHCRSREHDVDNHVNTTTTSGNHTTAMIIMPNL